MEVRRSVIKQREMFLYFQVLSSCPQNSLRSPQLIQNAEARMLTGVDEGDHLTLASLRLPIKSRIYKILFLI